MEPLQYNEVRTRPSLEERLESIISGAALMADSSCTRDERRERIVAECNAVRQALQDLLSEYMSNVSLSCMSLFLECVIRISRFRSRTFSALLLTLRFILQIGKKDKSDNLDHAIAHMCRKTRDLRRQLRKAVVDHVSDRYVKK